MSGIAKEFIQRLWLGTGSSQAEITATAAEINSTCDGTTIVGADITATAAEVNQLDASANISKMTPGAAITASAETYKVSTVRVGNVITTEMYIDLTGLDSIATDLDIIGKSTTAAHIGQVTDAVNGRIFSAKVSCAELPAGGTLDINICSSTAATGKLNDGGAALAGYVLDFDSGGALAIDGEEEWSTMPTANDYLYLLSGEAANAGTYTAGKLVITLKGLVV